MLDLSSVCWALPSFSLFFLLLFHATHVIHPSSSRFNPLKSYKSSRFKFFCAPLCLLEVSVIGSHWSMCGPVVFAHQGCSRDLNVETKTWSNLRDRDLIKKSETREMKIWGWCRYFQILKKYCYDCEVAIFSHFWHLSHLLWLFLIFKFSRQNTLIYKSFTKPYCCSTQSLKQMYLRPRP